MLLISWNVAGFRAVLKKGFSEVFDKFNADIVCLQESKVTHDQLEFHPNGYYEYLFPAERKGYSGTLIYSKIKPISVKYGIDNAVYDAEGRVITLEYEEFYLVNVYVPNAKRGLERLDDRMNFEDEFRAYLNNLDKIKTVIVCGDFNVAHTEQDIKNAKSNIGNAGFTYEERDKFTKLLSSGFIDTYRYFHPNELYKYSWWSYLGHSRENNTGWRIDYFLISKRSINKVINTYIYDDIMGSDHCPIGLEITTK